MLSVSDDRQAIVWRSGSMVVAVCDRAWGLAQGLGEGVAWVLAGWKRGELYRWRDCGGGECWKVSGMGKDEVFIERERGR